MNKKMSKKARNEKLKDKILELAKNRARNLAPAKDKTNSPKYSKDYYSHFP